MSKFISWIEDQASHHPLRIMLTFLILIYISYVASFAYEEKRPVKAFTEILLAEFFYLFSTIGGIAAGYFVGMFLYKITKRESIGWVLGIVAGVTVSFIIAQMGLSLDGVGWRLKLIRG